MNNVSNALEFGGEVLSFFGAAGSGVGLKHVGKKVEGRFAGSNGGSSSVGGSAHGGSTSSVGSSLHIELDILNNPNLTAREKLFGPRTKPSLLENTSLNKKTPVTNSQYEVTEHSVLRKIQREVRSIDILDALKNPLQICEIKYDSLGRPSQRYVGERATVAINPETRKIVSLNPTSSKKAQKLKKENK